MSQDGALTGDNLALGPVSYTYHAGPGWDPVTGWGSPNAQTLVRLLAHSQRRWDQLAARRATNTPARAAASAIWAA